MRLKELRTDRNLLQRDVADHLNCSTPVYCRYEKGEREPPFDIIKRLADFYGVTVDYLMGRDETTTVISPIEKAPADSPLTEQIMAKARLMTEEEQQQLLRIMDAVKK